MYPVFTDEYRYTKPHLGGGQTCVSPLHRPTPYPKSSHDYTTFYYTYIIRRDKIFILIIL